MKLIEKMFLTALLLAGAVVAFAKEKAIFKNDMKITVSAENAPYFEPKNLSSGQNIQNYKWLLINVEAQTEKGNGKTGDFADDIAMEVDVAVFNGKSKNVEQIVLFSGKVEYYSVELDGKKHNFLALVPGQLFYRYVDKSVRPAQENLRVQVRLYQGGELVSSGYYASKTGITDKEQKVWFAKFQSSKNYSVKVVSDSIFGRRETPWAMFGHDKYELEKKQNR